jgi:hypothetical protein
MQLLLDGKGWNAIGPNNCMPMTDWDLNIVTTVPPVMQPLLVRQNGWAEKWMVRNTP